MKQAALPFSIMLILVSCAPAAIAEQQSQAIVDSMLGIDPRTRRSSGTGAALDSVYGPEPDAPSATEELAPDEWERSHLQYGEAFKGLRSPLFEEDPSLDEEASTEEDLNSSFVPVIPLGRPEAREGVMYEDAWAY
jgi:hypothetical protein